LETKASLEVKGYAYFKKTAFRDGHTPPRIIDNSEIPLVAKNPPKPHLQFARDNNVRYESRADDVTENVIYYLDRPRFRKGLARAIKMSEIFIERAARSDGRRWVIYKVKPTFALSLMGVFGVVTVGAEASLELEYKR
jgi:hypothetical protein